MKKSAYWVLLLVLLAYYKQSSALSSYWAFTVARFLVFDVLQLGLQGFLIPDKKPTLLIFSVLSSPPFRSAKLRSKRSDCPACGHDGTGIDEILETDYMTFCGGPTLDYEQIGLEEGLPGYRIHAKVRTYASIHEYLERRSTTIGNEKGNG